MFSGADNTVKMNRRQPSRQAVVTIVTTLERGNAVRDAPASRPVSLADDAALSGYWASHTYTGLAL